MKPLLSAMALLLSLLLLSLPLRAATGLDHFEDVQWETHRIEPVNLTLEIPYDWEVGPSPFGDPLWFASGALGSPSLSVTVLPAPPGLTLEASAHAAAGGMPGETRVTGERALDLNGTPAREISFEVDLPIGAGVALQSRLVSVLRDDQWILINATDGRLESGFLPELEQALHSATFDAPAAESGAPRAGAESRRSRSRPFSFVALGDTAYNGEHDYPVYQQLIRTINATKPAFTIHVGDLWGIGNCHDAHMDAINEFFARYDHPVILTPGDNEWTDCDHRAMGGYDPAERMEKLREAFFAQPQSLGARALPLVRQGDIAPHSRYVENARWVHGDVLFFTVNVPGSNNNYRYDDLPSLEEAHARNAANVAWIRDSFRVAREAGHRAVVVALHAEILMNGRVRIDDYGGPLSGPHGSIVREIRRAGERFAAPVLLVHGDSHELVIDRPFLESRGESELPRYANITRLEVYGAPEIRAVQVTVDTSTPWVFGFAPLYDQ